MVTEPAMASGREWVSERELCTLFGVSHDTCRRHLREYAVLISGRLGRYHVPSIVRALGPEPAETGVEGS
jgi:hypothetical protein